MATIFALIFWFNVGGTQTAPQVLNGFAGEQACKKAGREFVDGKTTQRFFVCIEGPRS